MAHFASHSLRHLPGLWVPRVSLTFHTAQATLFSSMRCRLLATSNKSASLADRAAEFPLVVRQWHPSKNILQPQDVAPFSSKKVWFLCDQGHEWDARINARSQGNGCPMCANRKVSSTNNLLVKHPEIAAEWHSTKNGDLTTEMVTQCSGKKVWWQCKEGHEWEARVANRTLLKSGCLKCAIQRLKGAPRAIQSLLDARPDLALEWHPTKNGVLTPDAVSRAAKRKVWWQCPRVPAHEWCARVDARTLVNSGCPYCKKTARPLSETNNLLALDPEVAQEWHPTLNGELTPDKMAGKSDKKVWWRCKSCGHEWPARVKNRTGGDGCPKCGRKK
eukprot:Colp12_sorted_trinity150504_noHs@9835